MQRTLLLLIVRYIFERKLIVPKFNLVTKNKRELRQVCKARKRGKALPTLMKQGSNNPFRHYCGKRVAQTNGRHAKG